MDASHVPVIRYRIAQPLDRSSSSAHDGIASDRNRHTLTLGPTKAVRTLRHQCRKQFRSSVPPSASHGKTKDKLAR
jgi:hypothetical protein